MGEVYGLRPATWSDIRDPDLMREYDEAAYEVGTGIHGLQTKTIDKPYTPPKKPAKPTRAVPCYTPVQINAVTGYVPMETVESGDPGIPADVYAQLMGSLDGSAPSA